MGNSRLIRAIGRALGATANTSAVREETWIPKGIAMVSASEMTFYCETAARYVGTEGKIVDLGCWLGATSIALARGLLTQGWKSHSNEKVIGFDVFRWEDWMPVGRAYCLYSAGESFLPEARRVINQHGGGRVELVEADLRFYDWTGGSIKILLVDAMKTKDLAIQIAHSFFPSLIPGGLLIHQDFKHYFTGWIHLINYRLREYFRFYQSVPFGTVAFEVIKPIPQPNINCATDFGALLDEEVDSAFRYSLQLVKPEEQVNIAAAHLMLFVHLDRKDAAARTIEFYRPSGMLEKGDFPKALKLFKEM